MKTRSYSELVQFHTFEDRYEYLRLYGEVGAATFGHDRWMNQEFYHSREWKLVRQEVIARDMGCDLGVLGYDIHADLVVHHMNPMNPDLVEQGDPGILDPEFLITTTQRTHNAIHYGDDRLLPRRYIPRTPGDTRLW